MFTATSLGAALGAPLASLTGNALGWRVTNLSPSAQTAGQPDVLRVPIGWSLVMLAHFVVPPTSRPT